MRKPELQKESYIILGIILGAMRFSFGALQCLYYENLQNPRP